MGEKASWRKHPRRFGLVILGAWAIVVAIVAALSTIGVEEEGRAIILLLNGVGFVASAWWFYKGGSLIADPNQEVTFRRYNSSTGYVDGQRVDISTPGESVTSRLKPGTGRLMLVIGVVFWGFFGGIGLIGPHALDETEEVVDDDSEDLPMAAPTKVSHQ